MIFVYGEPGPRIRLGAWRQEISAARSLGKRVFRDKIKIVIKERKLHYFGKFMDFMTLLMGFFWAQCYVHKTLIKHTKVKQRKADNMHAQPGTSQIKCNQLQSRRPAHAHYRG